jgi:hypothetical protein
VIKNMANFLEGPPSRLDGFDELKPADKKRVERAFELGHIPEENIPQSARGGKADVADDEAEAEEAKTATKKAPAKRKKGV